MGRNIPSSESNPANNPALAFPLLAAGIAATIAILATLCITHRRKSSGPKSQPTSPSSLSSHKSIKKTQTSTEAIEISSPPPTSIEVQEQKQSPSTPEKKEEEVVIDVATHGPIGPTAPASAPRRKLSVSLSMKLPEGLSKIRTSKKDHQEKPTEESVWMKTIILGERCKVQSDDDEEEVVIYDDKGNKQRNYHPRTPRSLPAVSRTNSFAAVEVAAS